MIGPSNATTMYRWAADPSELCSSRTMARVAEVMTADPTPDRIPVPAGGKAEVRRLPERIVKCEKRGSVFIIHAQVENVGEVYDEIDSLLDRLEQDEEVHVVAIYTLNGLFASLPIR